MRDLQSAVRLLVDKAAPALSDAELRDPEGIRDHAEMQARYLRDVTMGLGCIVASDNDAISFRDGEQVSSLLWHISAAADHIASVLDLSDRAGCILLARQQREAQP